MAGSAELNTTSRRAVSRESPHSHVAAGDSIFGRSLYWMEAQEAAGSPGEIKKDQKLLKPSSSRELAGEPFQNSRGEEDKVIPGHTPSLLHVTDRRQPLSSVSSLEVHFDLLDLTELTDMSDQELAEVFVDSDEEIPASPATHHNHLGRGSYLRSPSWTRCSKPEQSHGRKHRSESDSKESHHKLERLKKP